MGFTAYPGQTGNERLKRDAGALEITKSRLTIKFLDYRAPQTTMGRTMARNNLQIFVV